MDKTCYNCGAPIAKAYCEGWPEVCEHWKPKKPPTNADRIRAMSDEELVELLALGCCRSPDTGCPKAFQTGNAWRDCCGCWLQWLQSPAGGMLSE